MKRLGRFLGAMIVLGASVPIAATSQDAFELVSDVDLTFWIGNPKTPWGPDLFRKSPGFAPAIPEGPKPKLQGIVFQGKQSTAFVDDRSIALGDWVGGRKVVEIGPNFVVLEDDDSQIELVLPAAPRRSRKIASTPEDSP